MKPFDLKAAKAGRPVCTRSGKAVKLIYFDAEGNCPIVGLIKYEEHDDAKMFKKDGKFFGYGIDDELDLFMV